MKKFHVVKRNFGADVLLATFSSDNPKEALWSAEAYLEGYIDGRSLREQGWERPAVMSKDGFFYSNTNRGEIVAVFTNYDNGIGRIATAADA